MAFIAKKVEGFVCAVLTMVSAVCVDQPRWGYSLFSMCE